MHRREDTIKGQRRGGHGHGQRAVVLGLALLGAWFGSVIFGALFQLANRSAPADSLGALNIWISALFRLPAWCPALRGEGKDFDIRISNVSDSQDPFGSAMPG